ncbi:MAG: hypothetical protein OEY20_00340 [Gemmatimonadota bacterium]|nr:hypothetical protein [Gemmatimonadota bacterium]MDH5195681.1 hypothetical protein [Gemmatimonadota bacterium]
MRSLYLLGLIYLAASLYALWRGPVLVPMVGPGVAVAVGDPASDGPAWFAQVRASCNALEVETAQRRYPPPTTLDGAGFSAACWALAGRMTEAREQIYAVQPDERWKAVGIVFNVGHPIADMGDDRSAGPIMELVVEFWPNHYMALYHAGAARFAVGDFALAEPHLREFLVYYKQNDGWTANARRMLGEIERR